MRFSYILTLSLGAALLLSPAQTNAQQAFSMEEAVAYALKENKSIDSAYSSAEAAESARKSARGAFGPSLSVDYQANKRSKEPDYYGGIKGSKETYNMEAKISQPLFTGFSLLANYQKAALQGEQAQAQRRNTELTTIGLVQENFLALLSARETLRSAQDSLLRLNTQLTITRQFYDVGLRPRLDVLQAETDVASAEDSLLQAQNNLDTQQARLNTLLNLPLEAKAEYVGALEFIPFAATLEDCLDRSYRLRPDVFIARKSVEISYKDKLSAASNFYPQIYGYVSAESQGDTWRAAGSDTTHTNYSAWNVGATGTWNLFEWGQSFYRTQQASHIISKVKADEEVLLQQVAYEVKSDLLKITEAAKRIKVAERGLAQAKEAFRMAQSRYEAQVGANIDVLTAQASLSQAEAYLTTAKADYLSALSKLYISMGEASPSLQSPSGISATDRVARPNDYTPSPDSQWPLTLPWTPYGYKTPEYELYPNGSAPAQPVTYDTMESAGRARAQTAGGSASPTSGSPSGTSAPAYSGTQSPQGAAAPGN